MSLSDPFVAEILAHEGYDAVTIDRQHGRSGPAGLWELALAISATGAAPLVRLTHLNSADITAALDAGFEGVICPMIESAEQAADLVSYTRYPPAGTRSYGPTRAALASADGFVRRSDEAVLCFAMIETNKALDNLEDIVAVPGLDGVYVGPADLALSMERQPILDDLSTEAVELMRRIASTARDAGKLAGIHCGSVSYARLMAESGFHLVTVGSDVRLLRTTARQVTTDFFSTGSEH